MCPKAVVLRVFIHSHFWSLFCAFFFEKCVEEGGGERGGVWLNRSSRWMIDATQSAARIFKKGFPSGAVKEGRGGSVGLVG